MKRWTLLSCAGLLASVEPAPAAYVGLTVESSENDGISTCAVYALFDDPQDALLSVAGVQGIPLTFEVFGGGTFFQAPFGTDTAPLEAVVNAFPETAYDTFVTIGLSVVPAGTIDQIVMSPGWPGFGESLFPEDPADAMNIIWSTFPGAPQGQAGSYTPDEFGNYPVLLGQFSTTDGAGITGRGVLQVVSDGMSTLVTFDFASTCSAGQIVSACCLPDLTCVEIELFDCLLAEGFPQVGASCGEVDCGASLGACCLGAGGCIVMSDPLGCQVLGGEWQGFGIGCDAVCVLGACCSPVAGCTIETQSGCLDLGGTWQGAGTECDDPDIECPGGACCVSVGDCVVLTEIACLDLGGMWQGSGTDCADGTIDCPFAACCVMTGMCVELTEAGCANAGGEWQGAGIDCGSIACTIAACCLPSGDCLPGTETFCMDMGGVWQGEGTTCGAVVCEPIIGACCCPKAECLETTEQACMLMGGQYQGDFTTCEDVVCVCIADVTFDGEVDALDVLQTYYAVLMYFYYGMCYDPCDLNLDGAVDVYDFMGVAVAEAQGGCSSAPEPEPSRLAPAVGLPGAGATKD